MERAEEISLLLVSRQPMAWRAARDVHRGRRQIQKKRKQRQRETAEVGRHD